MNLHHGFPRLAVGVLAALLVAAGPPLWAQSFPPSDDRWDGPEAREIEGRDRPYRKLGDRDNRPPEHGPRVDESQQRPTQIVAMAAGASEVSQGVLSGIFVADRTGMLFFHSSVSGDGSREITAFKPIDRYFKPTLLAFADPALYVYDAKTRSIWTLDMGGATTVRQRRSFGTRIVDPDLMAVSPNGLMAVLEGSQLLILQEGQPATFYMRSRFLEAIGLGFSSWDTLHVLDRARSTLVTIRLRRLQDGKIEFLSESEATADWMGNDWKAMAIAGGTVYVADMRRVYAYLPADGNLVAVSGKEDGDKGIDDLAVTYEDIYLLRDGRIERFPRNEPVDVALEGTVTANRNALLVLHSYLAARDLLPLREVRADRDFPSVEGFLRNALVLPGLETDTGRPAVHFDTNGDDVADAVEGALSAADLAAWDHTFCAANVEFCAASSSGILARPVARGTKFHVPDLKVVKHLGLTRVLLDEQTLGEVLPRLVFSEEFPQKEALALVRRLNEPLAQLSDEQAMRLRREPVRVPIEQWTITAPVPTADFQDRASALWELTRHFKGSSIYSRRSLGGKAAHASMQLDPPAVVAPDPAAERCAALKAQRERWLDAIRFPLARDGTRAVLPNVLSEVRVGVIEKGSTVITSHQVFWLDQQFPTWYTPTQFFDLVAIPSPASIDADGQVVDDLATYSVEAHHGTHVAALIAGRQGACWGGLLPHGRLILVPLGDGSVLSQGIRSAVTSDVMVFNVSQEFEGVQPDLQKSISTFNGAVFVAAAGNSSGENNLDQRDVVKVPAAARWGDRANVIVVSATDLNGTVLPVIERPGEPRKGANFGKRYVDLFAVGSDLMSATAQHKYGPASGTSQAAPQVAAAAALLADSSTSWRLPPGDVKARLIATADWSEAYEGQVWGGRLNFAAAVAFPDRNILRTQTGADLGQVHSFTPANDPRIFIANLAPYYERQGTALLAPPSIPFSRILSLKRRSNGNYRVVLREPGTDRLKIILDAELRDQIVDGNPVRIACSDMQVWKYEVGAFAPSDTCVEGLSVTQIEEYVQGGPYRIKWEAGQ